MENNNLFVKYIKQGVVNASEIREMMGWGRDYSLQVVKSIRKSNPDTYARRHCPFGLTKVRTVDVLSFLGYNVDIITRMLISEQTEI